MHTHARRVAPALVAAWLLIGAAQARAAVDPPRTTTVPGPAAGMLASAGAAATMALPGIPRAACAAADFGPGAFPRAALRAALRCVVTAQRAAYGLAPLRPARSLARAAGRHARDMVRRGYFAHERADSTLPGRLRAARWHGARSGEAIAWGCAGLGAPRAILQAWLLSPLHRAIVLGDFRSGGIGFAAGAPAPAACAGAGTWVLDVGS